MVRPILQSAGFTLVLSAVIASGQVYRIQPLGDSITQGVGGEQGYRYRLWQKLIDAGIAFDYVGSKTDNGDANPPYPNYRGRVFDRQHEGHGGWRAEDILDGCTSSDPCTTENEGYLAFWLASYTPDIALIHIGTNDIFQGAPQSVTITSIHNIITTLRFDNPNVIILLAQLIPTRGSDRDIKIRALNAQIPGIAADRDTPESPVIVVDMYTGFNLALDTFDEVHPNASGEEKMAIRWRDAILEGLNPNDPPVVSAGLDRSITWIRDTVNLIGSATDDGNPVPPGALNYQWLQASGPGPAGITRSLAPVSPVTFPQPGAYTINFAASDGELFTVNSVAFDVAPYVCPPLHLESGGQVVIEAEAFRSRAPGTGAYENTYWVEAFARPGYSGTSGMAAMPVAGSTANTVDALTGCWMDYWIEFSTPGTYTAWVRMLGPAGDANSIHLGLNGSPLTLGLRGMEEDTGTWQWIGTANAQPVQVVIPAPGRYRLDVWMREDGTYIDKIVLDLDGSEAPTGTGPAVSPSREYCDFDEDGMNDLWELDHWPDLSRAVASANSDTDAYPDGAEAVAGTDPFDAMSFPRIPEITPGTPPELSVLSAEGRRYQLEVLDPGSGDWVPAGDPVTGTGDPLILPDPAPTPLRLYRFCVTDP